jgi:hypothetical protein
MSRFAVIFGFCPISAGVGEPEWGGRSSAGAVWMRTDEGDSIDKRVKEMWKEREDSSSLFSNDLFLHRLCFKLKLSYWFKIHQIRYFPHFSYFSFLFFLKHFSSTFLPFGISLPFINRFSSLFFYLLCLDCHPPTLALMK